jgi:cellulose synthase/poly-beta-1,6-N-acetylglucosamine synthase-like glycosyltransferase
MALLAWVCAVCLLGVTYSHFVYPILLLVLPKRGSGIVRKPQQLPRPRVSLIVACRNEVLRLEHKLRNALELKYPNLEVLVASDASDDGSDDIARRFESRGVRLVRSEERRGKEHAQKLAVAASTGAIIVFSDAGTETPPDSVQRFVARFDDPLVGAVSSEDQFIADGGQIVGEGAYVRYEMWLRRLESEANSLVGLSGSFFAVRRSVAELMDESIPSDFACAINAYRLGLVSVTAPEVRGIYRNIKDESKEFQRKVRTALRGMAAIAKLPEVLNPIRYGMFAFQVWSHKVLRWLVPWFLLGLLTSSAALACTTPTAAILLAGQASLYSIALAGHAVPPMRRIALVRLAYFYCVVNAALLVASVQFMAGKRVVTWNPSVR